MEDDHGVMDTYKIPAFFLTYNISIRWAELLKRCVTVYMVKVIIGGNPFKLNSENIGGNLHGIAIR